MSEIRTNILISGESSEYRSNIEISVVTLNSALVDTHSSFRTNLDITTTLKDGSISAIKTNLELNNVALKFYLVDMTKLKQSLLYFSKFFNMYFEPEVMWDLLAQGTNEQINISHLNEALSNYVKIDITNNILIDLERVKLNLQEHIKDNKKHFTEKEKEFLLNLMENPNSFGSGDSLFEKVSINQNNIILPAVKPLKQDGKDAGIISNTFISCRGVDSTASGGSGGITRIDLFNILSGEPINDSEFINNKFLKISPLIENWIRNNLADYETDPTVPIFVKNITEDQIKSWDAVASWFDISEDESYIFTTNERGFVSHSFISCKGLDLNAASSGGSFSRSELFDILSDNPQEGERINLQYLIGLEELVESFGFLKSINKNQITTALGYTPLKKEDFKDFATVSNIVKQDVDNWNFIFSLIGLSEDGTYIFPKENRGFVSDSFISCKGLDKTAPQVGGTFDRSSLFEILSNEPQDGEFIDLRFLNLNDYASQDDLTILREDFDKLEEAVNPLFGYFDANGNANNALKLGGHSADYFATADSLNTHITAFNNYKTTTDNRLNKLEALWYMDDDGNVHTTHNIVVDGGGAFGKGAESGDIPSASVSIKFEGSNIVYSPVDGIITLPAYPSAGGGVADSVDWAKVYNKPTTLGGYGITDALSTSGGTITGQGYSLLSINRTDRNRPTVEFKYNGGLLGYLGFVGETPSYISSIGDGYILLHSGNYSDYALPKSGGNMDDDARIIFKSSNTYGASSWHLFAFGPTFQIKATTYGSNTADNTPIIQISNSGELYNNGNAVIHSGNIGSQSVNYANSAFAVSRFLCKRDTGFDANSNEYLLMSDYGSGIPKYNIPDNYTYGSIFTPLPNNGDTSLLGQFAWDVNHNTSTPTRNLWFRASNNLGWGSDWKQIAFTDSNVASATKLQTARTIWGQSFDGSGNVNGTLAFAEDEPSRYITKRINSSAVEMIRFPSASDKVMILNRYGIRDGYGLFTGGSFTVYSKTWGTADFSVINGNVLIGSTTDNGDKLQIPTGYIYTNGLHSPTGGYIWWNEKGLHFNSTAGTEDGNSINLLSNGNVLIHTMKDWGFNLAVRTICSNKTSGILGQGGGAFFGNIDEGYGTAIWTQGNGNGYIQQGRSNGEAVSYNLVMQHLGGNVLIGTTDDDGHKLRVSGRIKGTGYNLDNTSAIYCGLMPNSMITSSGDSRDIWLYNNDGLRLYGSIIDLHNHTEILGDLKVKRMNGAGEYFNIHVDDINVTFKGYDSDGGVYMDFYSNDTRMLRMDGFANNIQVDNKLTAPNISTNTLSANWRVEVTHASDATTPTDQAIVINSATGASTYAGWPGIGFHIPGITYATIKFGSDTCFHFMNYALSGWVDVKVGNLVATGGGAFGSDIRYKDITSYKQLDLETIVNAPLFSFRWTDREDKVEHLGTSAQYWLDTQFKDAVNITNPEFFHLDYGALGVGIGISVAREVKGVKNRVELLEEEVKQLKQELAQYRRV